MAELRVGEGQQYRTLAAAAGAARPGDIIVVHQGVYRETLRPPAGTTWQAEPGAVIDGGWDGGAMRPEAGNDRGVLISARGVTLRGFEIRNVAGNGIAVGAGGDDCLIERCEVHDTLDGALSANGTGTTIRGITVRGCHFHDISLSGTWYETPVNGCFLFKGCEDVLLEDNITERGHGEGGAFGTRSKRLTMRRCVFRRMTHLLFYVSNRAQDVLVEDSIFYQLAGEKEFRQDDGDVGQGLVIGDELSERSVNWQHGEDIVVRRCLVVNAGSGLSIRNQIKTVHGKPDGYDTTAQRILVENCTFVTGNNSKAGVGIQENERPGKSVKATFRKNLFIVDRLGQGGVALRNNAAGVKFEMNAWSVVPDGVGPSNAEIAASALVAPFAEEFDINNYRPRADGPLATAGLGALGPDGPNPPPPPPPPDPDPEPGVVDWDALLEKAAGVGARLATMGEAGNKAREHLAAAGAELAIMSLAHEDAVDDLAALLTLLEEYRLG